MSNLRYSPILYKDGNSAYGLKSDNNPTARAKRRFYIYYIAAPPSSPNFNVIEKGWRTVKSTIKYRDGPQKSLEDLYNLILVKWGAIPQLTVLEWFDRFSRVIKECWLRNGYITSN